MHIQRFRLWPRRQPDGTPPLDLCCDIEGLSLGRASSLIDLASDADGRPRYRVRPTSELDAVLSAAYGVRVDSSPIRGKLEQIAERMTSGEWTKATLTALHLRLPDLADERALARLEEAEAFLKYWVPDLHPRWPKDSEDGQGGRFRPRDGSDGLLVPVQGPVRTLEALIELLFPKLGRPPLPRPPLPKPPLPKPPGPPTPQPPPRKLPAPEAPEPPGIGHNNPPEPIEPEPPPPGAMPVEVPQIPLTRPGSPYEWGREVARALDAAFSAGNEALATAIARAADAVGWLVEQYRNIETYFDPPKTYEEFSANARIKISHPGYEDHHIVEQGEHNSYLDQSQIKDPANVVRIPYYRHKDVNSYYQTPQDELGGLTPRQYLHGKSFEEQLEFGLQALRKLRIMK